MRQRKRKRRSLRGQLCHGREAAALSQRELRNRSPSPRFNALGRPSTKSAPARSAEGGTLSRDIPVLAGGTGNRARWTGSSLPPAPPLSPHCRTGGAAPFLNGRALVAVAAGPQQQGRGPGRGRTTQHTTRATATRLAAMGDPSRDRQRTLVPPECHPIVWPLPRR